VILLILVVLLWAAVLAPSAWRRFAERQGVGSIDHFHHQLQLLEHAGPKTVRPAYRLHTGHPGESHEVPHPMGAAPRPKLVLLRPTDDPDVADVDDRAGGHYERVGVLDPPEAPCAPEVAVDLRSLHRQAARRRCTVLLRCLGGVAISTALIGMIPGLHVAWVFTGLSGLAALGLVALMAYARELEAEQERRRTRRRAAVDAHIAGTIDPAGAGFPGAWDEVDDGAVRRVAAR
jgi:hypothetical protein